MAIAANAVAFFSSSKNSGAAALVDPYDGDVLFFSTVHGFVDCFHKNGWWRMEGGPTAWGRSSMRCLENLWRTKAEAYGELMRPCFDASYTVAMDMTV